MAAKTPKMSWKDMKENTDGNWLRWLMAKRQLANDQSAVKCATPRASLRDTTQSCLFTKTQKTHARQIHFHCSQFYLTVTP